MPTVRLPHELSPPRLLHGLPMASSQHVQPDAAQVSRSERCFTAAITSGVDATGLVSSAGDTLSAASASGHPLKVTQSSMSVHPLARRFAVVAASSIVTSLPYADRHASASSVMHTIDEWPSALWVES